MIRDLEAWTVMIVCHEEKGSTAEEGKAVEGIPQGIVGRSGDHGRHSKICGKEYNNSND